jgi:hypothetical protein
MTAMNTTRSFDGFRATFTAQRTDEFEERFPLLASRRGATADWSTKC